MLAWYVNSYSPEEFSVQDICICCRCLSGREAAYTIHGFEVNIHASESSSVTQVPSGSSKVSGERERSACFASDVVSMHMLSACLTIVVLMMVQGR